jgi:hypothetical protein
LSYASLDDGATAVANVAKVTVTRHAMGLTGWDDLSVTGAITGGGALIPSLNGECLDQLYVVTDQEDAAKCNGVLCGG